MNKTLWRPGVKPNERVVTIAMTMFIDWWKAQIAVNGLGAVPTAVANAASGVYKECLEIARDLHELELKEFSGT